MRKSLVGGIMMCGSALAFALATHVAAMSGAENGRALATAPLAQAQPAQDEFVPIDELPPEDQLPAAPLLGAAYAVAWIVVLGYLWSLWRRLGQVEQDLADVARRIAERNRPA